MSTDSERDQMTDRMLRKSAIRPRGAAADGEVCIDAETLAAWADGALSAADAEIVESHLADCARCQAMVAAFAESEPVGTAESDAAPVVVPFRARSAGRTMRWLIPAAVGTVAATLLVWTAWPKPDATLVQPDATMASRDMRAPEQLGGRVPESTPSMSTPAPAAAPATSEVRADQKTSSARQGKGAVAEERVLVPTPSPIAIAPPSGAPPAAPVRLPQMQSDPTIATRQAPVPPAVAQDRTDVITVDSAARLAKAAAPTGPGARVVAEFAPADPPQPGASQGFGARGGGATAAANRAMPRIRWRVHASGAVTKSTDAGENWQPIAISPPAIILNGAAPSPAVCWLIGRAGIVMRSIDGVKFVRVAFPDVADLRSIKAVDAREATVTTMDGRVFLTMDGGETWVSGT